MSAMQRAGDVLNRSIGIALGVGVLALGGAAAALFYGRGTPGPTPPPGSSIEEHDAADIIAWCAEGLTAIEGGGCLAGGRDAASPMPLIVYLHGIYDRDATSDEMDRQRRLAKQANARGFAVLALRGREGECSAELPTKFCWPSNERNADAGAEFVSRWSVALDAAAKRVGVGKRYVLGFSNGAYFAGLIATRALFPADAFVVAHGGPVQPVRALGAKPPLLLMSADDDLSQYGMIALDDELTREAWPHESYAREGGHALTDADIEAALTFFVRSQTEKVPLSPPLSTHRARARDVPYDAGADADMDFAMDPAPAAYGARDTAPAPEDDHDDDLDPSD